MDTKIFPNFKENTAIFSNSKDPGPQSQKGMWARALTNQAKNCSKR